MHDDCDETSAPELTADDLREIEEAASKIMVRGARYPEHLQERGGKSSGRSFSSRR